jgi:hypothetical protein
VRTSVNVNVSPVSGSVADNVPTVVPAGWFSATLEFERAMSVGAWLTITNAVVPGGQFAGSPTRLRVLAFDAMSAQKYLGVFEGTLTLLPAESRHGGVRTECGRVDASVIGRTTITYSVWTAPARMVGPAA